MSLCVDCARLDLAMLFVAVKTSNEFPIQERTLSALSQFSKTCNLCRLVLKIILFQDPLPSQTDHAQVVCKIYLRDYVEILSQPSGAILPPEGIPRFGANVESVPQLYIHLKRGDQREFGLPLGLQTKATDTSIVNRSTALRGRLVGLQVDIQLLLKWLKICSEHHGAICTPGPIRHGNQHPVLRVIDVQRFCVVELASTNQLSGYGPLPLPQRIRIEYRRF